MKKFLALLLALTMVLSLAACGNNNDADEPVHYTFKSYTGALATNWNPHTWENNSDSAIMAYLEAPLATMSVKDSENGVYQWIFVAAESVTDVTADHKDDLTKYEVTLPQGKTIDEVEDGYVYEIKLRPEMKWQDGTPINADTYIYSMEQLLNPEMHNYRANLYYAGESMVAGGDDYYYAGSTAWIDAASAVRMTDLVAADGVYTTADGTPVKFALTTGLAWLGGDSLQAYVDAYGDAMFDVASFESLLGMADDNGNVDVTDETIGLLTNVITFSADWGETADNVADYLVYGRVYPECEYDGTVGCYKVDDYTIRYVTQARLEYNYFLTSCTSNWLVYEELYEAGKDTSGTLVTTDYGTSVETYMAYGPYRLESLQEGKQMVLVKNENYYAYTKDEETGRLVATTDYLVDGENVPAWETDTIVIDVMDSNAAKQAFLKGQLSSWTPAADDLITYATSEQMYKAPETYTMSFFFNCGLENLKTMDESKGNTNSVVLSNWNFRKAMSLAVDRDEFVGATAGYIPAYSILNSLYYYDVYNDPTSSYRNSDPAMQAICNYYGVEYGENTPYADLKSAYESINGYNLTEAQNLMKTACDELVAEGLYTAGEPIHIRVAYTAAALESSHNQQMSLMNKYINAAAEGSGFGTITLEAIGNLNDRYADVANGEYAIGYGAWGGAAFYPFRIFQVYCDPEKTNGGINEAGCWDPMTETLTVNVDGEEITKTWQDWSNCMFGTGDLAEKSFETKLQILATMEENYLNFVYRIPLCSTTASYLNSYQVNEYTTEYNIMYGFGGTELMTYNYTDAEWEAYVAEQGGTLSYE